MSASNWELINGRMSGTFTDIRVRRRPRSLKLTTGGRTLININAVRGFAVLIMPPPEVVTNAFLKRVYNRFFEQTRMTYKVREVGGVMTLFKDSDPSFSKPFRSGMKFKLPERVLTEIRDDIQLHYASVSFPGWSPPLQRASVALNVPVFEATRVEVDTAVYG